MHSRQSHASTHSKLLFGFLKKEASQFSSAQILRFVMETYPVGVRFLPTEEELVLNHLKSKIVGCTDEDCFIPVLDDFYAWDPWNLPQVYQGNQICTPTPIYFLGQ